MVHNISINWRICAPAIAVLASSVLADATAAECGGTIAAHVQAQAYRTRHRQSRDPSRGQTQLEAVAQIRDFATRVWACPTTAATGVIPTWPALRGVECGGGAGVFRGAEGVVLSDRRVRGVSRIFRRAPGEAVRAEIAARGLDVTVGGVAAYSTLGHFDDPILNTMLGWSDVELARSSSTSSRIR